MKFIKGENPKNIEEISIREASLTFTLEELVFLRALMSKTESTVMTRNVYQKLQQVPDLPYSENAITHIGGIMATLNSCKDRSEIWGADLNSTKSVTF